jgi:hypothetical protein
MQGCTKIIATCRRNSGEVCGPGLLAGVYFMASAVEPYCELIRGLNKNGCYTLRCTDDIANLICGKIQNTISELLQEVLGTTQQ